MLLKALKLTLTSPSQMVTNVTIWPKFTPDFTIMMTLLSNARSTNACPSFLSLQPFEANDAKLGSHGKHDRQIALMVFLQKVLFDERITTNFSP